MPFNNSPVRLEKEPRYSNGIRISITLFPHVKKGFSIPISFDLE